MIERDELVAVTRRYHDLKPGWDEVRKAAADAVIAALRSGLSPTEVTELGPFTAAYVRKLARQAGIPPASPGPKRHGDSA